MTMNITKDNQWRDGKALERYMLIAPLLEGSLDPAKRLQMREGIASRNGISLRSLYRYEAAFKKEGFSGLKPAERPKQHSAKLPDNFKEILEQAVQLKREVPTRSVNQIIYILELEGWAPVGTLKRSTMQRHLYNAGFGQKQMQMYRDARNSSSKRFCKPHRMMLIQGDIKYGIKLPIGKNGAMVQTYLSSAIDDHSRYVLHSRFYDNQEESIVEDTFHKAILKAGKFDACYFDNGSQYISRQLRFSLSRLGITIRHAPVRSGKSKGKCEKFHQIVDRFLAEVKVHNIRTLEGLNVTGATIWKNTTILPRTQGSGNTMRVWVCRCRKEGSPRSRNGTGIPDRLLFWMLLWLRKPSCTMRNVWWTKVPASVLGERSLRPALP